MTLKSDRSLNHLSRNRFTTRYDGTIPLAHECNLLDIFPFFILDYGSRNEQWPLIIKERVSIHAFSYDVPP
jgi:hypothetical protein